MRLLIHSFIINKQDQQTWCGQFEIVFSGSEIIPFIFFCLYDRNTYY